jgi:hypothetical protein
MRVSHSVLKAKEQREARLLGGRLSNGDLNALMQLELRLLRATYQNDHFVEWISEIIQHMMSADVRKKLRVQLASCEMVHDKLKKKEARTRLRR